MKADQHPVGVELIRRYNEVSEALRVCPHLQMDLDQPRFWVEAVPELLACKACTPAVAAEEQKRKNSLCLFCRRHVSLRGVTIAAGPLVLRCGVCADCERERWLTRRVVRRLSRRLGATGPSWTALTTSRGTASRCD